MKRHDHLPITHQTNKNGGQGQCQTCSSLLSKSLTRLIKVAVPVRAATSSCFSLFTARPQSSSTNSEIELNIQSVYDYKDVRSTCCEFVPPYHLFTKLTTTSSKLPQQAHLGLAVQGHGKSILRIRWTFDWRRVAKECRRGWL